mmetsp:Transcript_16734/g.25286  ORF Transcript_16734/g.25286 Transcript_16734/m.25286 type:complete len:207 (+) Transcript_16734:78-698(+)
MAAVHVHLDASDWRHLHVLLQYLRFCVPDIFWILFRFRSRHGSRGIPVPSLRRCRLWRPDVSRQGVEWKVYPSVEHCPERRNGPARRCHICWEQGTPWSGDVVDAHWGHACHGGSRWNFGGARFGTGCRLGQQEPIGRRTRSELQVALDPIHCRDTSEDSGNVRLYESKLPSRRRSGNDEARALPMESCYGSPVGDRTGPFLLASV